MRRSETIGVWKLVVIVCVAAAGAAFPAKASQAAARHDGRSVTKQRTNRGAAAIREGTGYRISSLRHDVVPSPEGATMALGGSAGVTCAQPAANCQEVDNFNAFTSNRTRWVLAEDFTPQTGGSITSVCWWGAYGQPVGGNWVNCQGQYPDTFELRYYANDGGAPQDDPLATFSQDAGTLTVTGPVATGALVAGQLPEYEFTATHDPVAVEAGQCYWIEISNETGICRWFWEIAGQGNGRAQLDGDGLNPPDGYELGEWIPDDLAFCLDLALGDPTPCVPPRPSNDDCSDARSINDVGEFLFDNTTAWTDGTPPVACWPSSNTQLESDVWFCWPAPCTDTILVSTCQLADVDTMIAVYDGCDVCPPGENEVLTCNDNRCGAIHDPRQSMAVFDAVEGQNYLIRIGTYPGEKRGSGLFSISCGPPNNLACPGAGDCCEDLDTVGCNDEACCRMVCACDPFCCDAFWDEGCATDGFLGRSGCGAELLCVDRCAACGNPAAGDCCADNGTVACSDQECCDLVCECDPVCCDNQWDHECAIRNQHVLGCDAATLCPNLCNEPGDLDGDGDVDLDDYDEFMERCFAGPGTTTSDPACGPADFDDNGTVDLKDFAGFQNAFGGP